MRFSRYLHFAYQNIEDREKRKNVFGIRFQTNFLTNFLQNYIILLSLRTNYIISARHVFKIFVSRRLVCNILNIKTDAS